MSWHLIGEVNETQTETELITTIQVWVTNGSSKSGTDSRIATLSPEDLCGLKTVRILGLSGVGWSPNFYV